MGLKACAYEASAIMSYQHADNLVGKLEPSLQAKLDVIDKFKGKKISSLHALKHLHEEHLSKKPSAECDAGAHLAAQLEWETKHSKDVFDLCGVALGAVASLRDLIPRILMGANRHHRSILARAVEGAPACTHARPPARKHACTHACVRSRTRLTARNHSLFPRLAISGNG